MRKKEERNGRSYPPLLKSSNLVAVDFCPIWNSVDITLLNKEGPDELA